MPVDATRAFLLFRNERLRERTRILLMRSAVAVLSEAGTAPFHLERATWANRVIQNPEQEARRAWLLVVATAPALPPSESITDDQITAQVNSLINALAGAFNPVP